MEPIVAAPESPLAISDAAVQEVRLLLLGRGLRAFVDGHVAVLLPAYRLALGYGTWQVGLLSSATLLGSALAILVACACLKIAYDLALWRAFLHSDQVVSDLETK